MYKCTCMLSSMFLRVDFIISFFWKMKFIIHTLTHISRRSVYSSLDLVPPISQTRHICHQDYCVFQLPKSVGSKTELTVFASDQLVLHDLYGFQPSCSTISVPRTCFADLRFLPSTPLRRQRTHSSPSTSVCIHTAMD